MATFGDTSSGGDTFPMSDGRAICTKQTCPEAATVTGIWAYFGTGTTAGASFKGLIYSHSAALPVNLLITGDGTAIPAGGGWVRSPATGSLSASTLYYIGLVTNDGGGVSVLGEDASPTTFDTPMNNGGTTYSSPPSTWQGSDATYTIQINVYVEYTVAGGAATHFTRPDRFGPGLNKNPKYRMMETRQGKTPAAGAFRRTLTLLGTRTGSRPIN